MYICFLLHVGKNFGSKCKTRTLFSHSSFPVRFMTPSFITFFPVVVLVALLRIVLFKIVIFCVQMYFLFYVMLFNFLLSGIYILEAPTFQTSSEVTKRFYQIILFVQVITLKKIFEKLHCLLGKIMNNKQVIVYGLLESTNDLRSIFVGHIHFKKLMKFRKFIEIFHCCLTRLRNKK